MSDEETLNTSHRGARALRISLRVAFLVLVAGVGALIVNYRTAPIRVVSMDTALYVQYDPPPGANVGVVRVRFRCPLRLLKKGDSEFSLINRRFIYRLDAREWKLLDREGRVVAATDEGVMVLLGVVGSKYNPCELESSSILPTLSPEFSMTLELADRAAIPAFIQCRTEPPVPLTALKE